MFDVGRKFQCAGCGSEIVADGWAGVHTFEIIAFFVGGCVLVIAWAGFGWVGGAIALAAWIAAEVYARRVLLKLTLVNDALVPNEQRAT
jgi:hypothetical protein